MNWRKGFIILAIISFGIMIPFVAPYFTLYPEKSRVAITFKTNEE